MLLIVSIQQWKWATSTMDAFFNAVKSPPFHDGDITDNELRSRASGGSTVLGIIEGLVMIRNGGGRVFDLIPRQ